MGDSDKGDDLDSVVALQAILRVTTLLNTPPPDVATLVEMISLLAEERNAAVESQRRTERRLRQCEEGTAAAEKVRAVERGDRLAKDAAEAWTMVNLEVESRKRAEATLARVYEACSKTTRLSAKQQHFGRMMSFAFQDPCTERVVHFAKQVLQLIDDPTMVVP